MSTEKKKEQQLLEELSAQPAARSSYSTAGLSSRREVENALAKAEYSPSQSVTDAAADLKNWQQNRPGQYESAYQGRIEDLIGQLLGRDSFQYSYAQDPLYRQYARQYTQNARNASADAAAQAAALTGGYGSSYAVSAAQQAYQQQMGALNDALPSLYRLALDTYNSEGDDVVTRIDQLSAQEQNAQARYNAELIVSSTGRAAPTTPPMSRTMAAIRTIWAGWTPSTAITPRRNSRRVPNVSRHSAMC